MNLKSCNKVETNRYQLEVEVDEQSFNDALNRTYHKEIKKISLPGFRKGKAPRSFVEKYYGEQVFYEGAVNDIFPVAFEEAVKESKLDVITDNNDFEIVEIGKQGFTFKISVITKPEVNIANYKGLKIEPKDPEVKEEDIDAEINKTLDRYSRMVTMDKAAENDDIVVMDFEGSIDGVPFEGGAAENYSLTLGTKMFIPGFEDQLLGHKAGDEVDVNVSFPEDYHATELAGKPALFKVKIHEIKGKETPAFDDEFVKDISEHLQQNQVVKVKVLSIGEDGKISLSIKRANEAKNPPPQPRKNTRFDNDRPPQKKEPLSFEEMMSKYKQSSEEKMSDLRRFMDNKRSR